MKLMVASDIHGSAYGCQKMLEAFDREQADRLLLLGDLLYHGPRNALPREYAPKEVIKMLNVRKDRLLCVRGNCEAEVDQMVLEFPVMADSCILFWEGRMIFATHGHRYHLGALPPMQPGDILLHGHTHIPTCEQAEGILYMNPGSVSIPKNGSYPGYMTIAGREFLWKDLDGAVWNRYSL